MAAEIDPYMMGDDESLFMPAPLLRQRMQAANIRPQPPVAPGMPPMPPATPMQNAPTTPTPTPAQAQGVPTPTDLMRQIVERMGKRPDPEPYVEQARERAERSNRNTALAMTMAALGGESFSPFAQPFMSQAMKEAGDVEIPGGWGTVTPQGKVTWNAGKQEEADLARLTKLYDITSGEETKRLAQQRHDELIRANREQRLAAARTDDERADLSLRWRTEDQMQKAYEASTKTFREELDATRKVAQLAPTILNRRPNAIEQQSLMVLLNKFLDPGSVVREGEFDRVARAQGLIDRAANLLQRVAHGEPLSDKLIAEIVSMAKFYETAAQAKLQHVGDEFSRKARERRLDPANVITDPYYRPGGTRDQGGRGIDAGARLQQGGAQQGDVRRIESNL